MGLGVGEDGGGGRGERKGKGERWGWGRNSPPKSASTLLKNTAAGIALAKPGNAKLSIGRGGKICFETDPKYKMIWMSPEYHNMDFYNFDLSRISGSLSSDFKGT